MTNGICTRRAFLSGLSAVGLGAAVSTASHGDSDGGARRIGLALGAGGANGLAHIPLLEVLDELGLRPHRITGSSIGAVVGALYASGMRARRIRRLVDEAFSEAAASSARTLSEQASIWMDMIEVEVGRGGLLDSESVLSHFYRNLGSKTFDDLEIPFVAVAADLWSQQQVALESGPLERAVRASMALPGVFPPVSVGGRLLIDGGTVNPVPWDLLQDCELVIAVDVSGVRTPSEEDPPGFLEVLFNSVKVMQRAIVEARLRLQPPDLFLAPKIRDVRALEFYRADEIFAQAQPSAERLRRELGSRRASAG